MDFVTELEQWAHMPWDQSKQVWGLTHKVGHLAMSHTSVNENTVEYTAAHIKKELGNGEILPDKCAVAQL